MSEPTRADVVGRLLFGAPTRLKVCMWLAERHDELFYADMARADIGIYSASVGTVLQRLEELGMVCRDGSTRDRCGRCDDCISRKPRWCASWGEQAGRVVWWRKLEHPLWEIFLTAQGVLERPTAFQRDRAVRELAQVAGRLG